MHLPVKIADEVEIDLNYWRELHQKNDEIVQAAQQRFKKYKPCIQHFEKTAKEFKIKIDGNIQEDIKNLMKVSEQIKACL